MRNLFVVVSLLALMGSTSMAQDTTVVPQPSAAGLPFVTKPMTSARQLALIVETGRPQGGVGLYVDPDTLLVAWKTAFPDLGIETRASLANHIRSLKIVDCPNVVTNLAWVRGTSIRLTGWRRMLGGTLHPREQCLLNEEKGRIEVSLACGNIIPNLTLAPARVAVGSPQVTPIASSEAAQAPAAAPVVVPTPTPLVAQEAPREQPAGPVTRQTVLSRQQDSVGTPRIQHPLAPASTSSVSRWRSWKRWTFIAGLAAAGTCYYYSQAWGEKPFVCFVDETIIRNRTIYGG